MGEVEGSQERDATQVRAQGAGEKKQPLFTERRDLGDGDSKPSSQFFKGSGLLTAGERCSGDTTPCLACNLPEGEEPCEAVAHARSLGLHGR